MMTKKYCQVLLSVIEYIEAGHSEISRAKGTELSGDYWPRIFRLFQDEHVGVGIGGGAIHVTRPQYLAPIRADCLHVIEEIEKREEDRALDNEVKKSNMKYARRAYWISIVAIIISASALAWQIVIRATT